MENDDFTMVLGRFGRRWGGSPCDEANATRRDETSGAQAKLMHRVAGGLWMR